MWEAIQEDRDYWHIVRAGGSGRGADFACNCGAEAAALRIARLLNAEEIQLRHPGWTIVSDGKGWFVLQVAYRCFSEKLPATLYADEPATALIEADRWFREQAAHFSTARGA